MPDNNIKTKPLDFSRVNVNDPYEIEYWTKELGVTNEQLREAVNKVGTSVSAVRRHIKVKTWTRTP